MVNWENLTNILLAICIPGFSWAFSRVYEKMCDSIKEVATDHEKLSEKVHSIDNRVTVTETELRSARRRHRD